MFSANYQLLSLWKNGGGYIASVVKILLKKSLTPYVVFPSLYNPVLLFFPLVFLSSVPLTCFQSEFLRGEESRGEATREGKRGS